MWDGCVQSYRLARKIDGLGKAQASLGDHIDHPSSFGVEVIKHSISQDPLLDEHGWKGDTLIVLSAPDAHALENWRKVQLLALIDGAEHCADVTDALVGGADLHLSSHHPASATAIEARLRASAR
jgi:hypothetical protein